MSVRLNAFSSDRMVAAVDAVRERACRAAEALRRAGISHAIVGGTAVACWVARVDAEAVRNTKDVHVLVCRADFARVVEALASAGFVHHNVRGVDVFLDGPNGSIRSAVHVVFAAEKVHANYLVPAPDVTESEPGPGFPVPTLDALVRMKLTSFRLTDRVQLLDLLEVGLIDEGWCERLPDGLAQRLEELIASGNG